MPVYQRYRSLLSRAYQATDKPPTRFRLKKVGLIGLSLFLITAIISAGLSHRANEHAAAEAAWRQRQKALFAAGVNKLMADNPLIKFSVSATAVDADQLQSLGENQPQDAASTGKILTAIYYVKQVEAGQASLSQLIDGKTAGRQLQLMLQQSDDAAWQGLNQKLGHASLDRYARSIGLQSYRAETNAISAADLTKLLKDLARGNLLNVSHTGRLLSYMQRTNYEDFITPAVPTGYHIYHKVGIDADYINDAAIIAAPDGRAFVLSIMTDGQGLYQWPNRAHLMQRIAAAAVKAYLQ